MIPLVRSPAGLAGERVVGDLTDPDGASGRLEGLDAIVHAAARVHVMHDRAEDPLAEYRRANVAGTLGLAEAAAAAGVRRFVFVSSIKVNGERTARGRPFRPDDPPAPVGPYGRSKLEAERGLHKLGQTSGLEVVVVRPVLVYGPGVKANFRALMALAGRAIPLPLGGIANRRSLVFLGNLTDLIATGLTHPAAVGRVFLAADAEAVSTPELVTALAHAQGKRSWLPRVPVWLLAAAGRVTGRQAAVARLNQSLEVDISDAARRLDWTPPYALAEGLAATVAGRGRDGRQ